MGQLSREAEARNFARFWMWLSDLRRLCQNQDRTFTAYCFWAQAEDGAMNRAVATPVDDGPMMTTLADFRRQSLFGVAIHLDDLAKEQIQTDGLLGLKQLGGVSRLSMA